MGIAGFVLTFASLSILLKVVRKFTKNELIEKGLQLLSSIFVWLSVLVIFLEICTKVWLGLAN